MGPYLGDYKHGSTIYFCWDTNDKSGASITRATKGTIWVLKDDESPGVGPDVTDTEDWKDLAGIHLLKIELTDDWYAPGHDHSVVLAGATIDGEYVHTVIATFSIENRYAGSSLFEKAAKMLVNKAVQDKITGAIQYYDDDGETVVLTHTPSDGESTLTRTPS